MSILEAKRRSEGMVAQVLYLVGMVARLSTAATATARIVPGVWSRYKLTTLSDLQRYAGPAAVFEGVRLRTLESLRRDVFRRLGRHGVSD
jgi:hypothetical protein